MDLISLLLLILAIGIIIWGVQMVIANVPGLPAWVKGVIIGFLIVIAGIWLLQGGHMSDIRIGPHA